MSESEPKKSRTLVGTVTSDVREKTITVRVDWSRRHPMYEKIVRSFTKYHVHDAAGVAKIGDSVRIQECRPISKTKFWTLVEVLGG